MTAVGSGYVAGLVIAGVLIVAALAKANNRRAVIADFEAMGIRRPAVVAGVVPLTELLVAAVLVTVGWPGAVGALALLTAFTVILARLVGAGSQATCACFGAVDRRPVTRWHLIRNAGLMALSCWALSGRRTMPTVADVLVVGGVCAVGTAAFIAARSRVGRV